VVEGAEFSAALFGIWIGGAALDEGLRDELLAGPTRASIDYYGTID
jgi:hypothetical protein